MPLYEYQCENCGDVFEVMQKFSDEPLKVHEKCGGGPVKKLLSAPAFHFKGSGWYVTDYAKSGSTSSSESKDSKDTKSSQDSNGSGAKSTSSESSPTKTESSSAPATPAAPSSDTK